MWKRVLVDCTQEIKARVKSKALADEPYSLLGQALVQLLYKFELLYSPSCQSHTRFFIIILNTEKNV